ncbi:uncharacterized protein LAJ45_06443 [Morchella importuna]|uniref:uncharacterized protein n=1 Tax=Morchella importuna TaxID=1174673 RepID=UPI001E8DC73A|nr:uncharacterized protein LAJ45_06443 [Morchella importuna]KAH8149364.1 hypothetical protein LAJ45_06443 [Morchella importuna]
MESYDRSTGRGPIHPSSRTFSFLSCATGEGDRIFRKLALCCEPNPISHPRRSPTPVSSRLVSLLNKTGLGIVDIRKKTKFLVVSERDRRVWELVWFWVPPPGVRR